MLRAISRFWQKAALRTVHEKGVRLARIKLSSRDAVRAALHADPEIEAAVRAWSAEHSIPKADVRAKVDGYIREIVPFFNILVYYKIGYNLSRWMLNLFYKVSADHADPGAVDRLPRDAIVVYLMNHRSNADYVLVGYVLSGRVAISYAVGEWARAFPLEYIFKTFGSYFIRRNFREPLYHKVLERYVQLITRNGVTQGIFPEGGLTRDGTLRPAKIGLLDYILGVARDADYRSRLYVVPVAINYDRVLEDRTLLRELDSREGRRTTSRFMQMREVTRYLWWNGARIAARRWKRYGRAAVTVGAPVSLAPWLDAHEEGGRSIFDLPRPERLARVQALADEMMTRIGGLIPVTPVPLVCAAIQSLDGEYIPRARLLARMADMREVLLDMNARVIRAEGEVSEILDLALRMLTMRRMVAQAGDGYAILGRNRPLVSYYANSIAHLLGPFADGVRERDVLPVMRALDV